MKAHYDAHSQQVVIQLSSPVEIRFSPQDAKGLDDAYPPDLDLIEIAPSGFEIHFPKLDADLSVPALPAGHLTSKKSIAGRQNVTPVDTQYRPKVNRPILSEVKTREKPAWRGLNRSPAA